MTIEQLLDWAYNNNVTWSAQICVVSSAGAISQVVEMDHLAVDEDGDVIIQL